MYLHFPDLSYCAPIESGNDHGVGMSLVAIMVGIGLLAIAAAIHSGLYELRQEVRLSRHTLAKVIQDFEILKVIFQRIEGETSLRRKIEEENIERLKRAERDAMDARVKAMIADGGRMLDG